LAFAAAPTIKWAVITAVITSFGGPMCDVPLLTLLQLDLPGHQLGKVFSLRSTMENGGAGFGLWAAAGLFAVAPLRSGLVACAMAMGLAGAAGLLRFRRGDVVS
jgi:hypothetical protein